MTKQEVNLKVLPADASNKELTVTLSDKNVATLKATANGVELDAKNGGTANLEVRSHYGEVERNIPVNVQSKTSMTVDGVEGTASRYVNDLPEMNLLTNSKPRTMTCSQQGNVWVVATAPFLGKMSCDPKLFVGKKIYANIKANVPDNIVGKEVCVQFVYAGYVTSTAVIATKTMLATNAVFEITPNMQIENKSEMRFYIRNYDGSITSAPTIEVESTMVTLHKLTDYKFYPAPEDYGVVHGQPNLLNGTSDEWETFSFSTWDVSSEQVTLSSIGLAVGDKIAFRCECDNTQSSVKSKFKIVYRDKDFKTIRETSPTIIPTGAVGVSQGEDVVPEGAVYLYWAKAGKLDGTTQSTILARKHKLIKGSLAAMDDWTPSQSDFEGLPNLLDGTMGTWQDYNFSGWFTSSTSLNIDTDFAVGDTFTLTSEIDNTKNTVGLYTSVVTELNDGTLVYKGGNTVIAGTSGVSTVSVSIPSNVVKLTVRPIAKGDGTTQVTGRFRRIKLVKGDVSQLGIWLPKNRTEYDKTLGIVPFTQPEYDTLQSADGIVRAETTIVGRGAEIQFDFDVIATIEAKYPSAFAGLTTMAEKIAKFKTLVKRMKVQTTIRGFGLNSKTGDVFNKATLYIKASDTAVWGMGTNNGSSNFINLSREFTSGHINLISTNGFYIFFAVSQKNNFTDIGSISDGVTPAWVEVQDIRLEVTIQPPEDPNAQPITITIPSS